MKSRLRVTGTKVTLESGEEFLVTEIVIDCDVCGPQRFVLAGHHLRAIRDGLIELIDLYPTLTGKDSDHSVLNRLRVTGAYPPDPTKN